MRRSEFGFPSGNHRQLLRNRLFTLGENLHFLEFFRQAIRVRNFKRIFFLLAVRYVNGRNFFLCEKKEGKIERNGVAIEFNFLFFFFPLIQGSLKKAVYTTHKQMFH